MAAALETSADGDGTPSQTFRVEVGEISQREFDAYLAEYLSQGLASPLDAEGISGRLIGGLRPEPAIVRAVRELRESGFSTALLSNSWGQEYPVEALNPLFDHLVISSSVGLRKPQTEIYRLAATLLEVEPERCVFVDDTPGHVVGAESVGMIGLVHKSADRTIESLEELFGVRLSRA